MCLTQIIKQLNGGSCPSKKNWMCTFYMAPFLSFFLFALRKGHKLQPMQPAAFQNCLGSYIKTSINKPEKGLKNLSFSIICAAFYLHLYYTPLLWFCLGKQKGMQSQHIGHSRNESLNKTPSWKWSWHAGTQYTMDSSPSTVSIYWQ